MYLIEITIEHSNVIQINYRLEVNLCMWVIASILKIQIYLQKTKISKNSTSECSKSSVIEIEKNPALNTHPIKPDWRHVYLNSLNEYVRCNKQTPWSQQKTWSETIQNKFIVRSRSRARLLIALMGLIKLNRNLKRLEHHFNFTFHWWYVFRLRSDLHNSFIIT